jgi:GTP-binding protein Era
VGGAHDADIVALLIDAKKGSTRRPSDPRQARDVAPPKCWCSTRSISPTSRAADARAGDQRARRIRRDLHASALTGDGVERLKAWLARMRRRAVALSGGPDFRRADAPASRRRSRARKLFDRLHQELPYQATVETIVEGAARRLGAHRADDLCGARKPAQDRARQGRRDHQGDRRRGAQEIAD